LRKLSAELPELRPPSPPPLPPLPAKATAADIREKPVTTANKTFFIAFNLVLFKVDHKTGADFGTTLKMLNIIDIFHGYVNNKNKSIIYKFSIYSESQPKKEPQGLLFS
jgi:hypothetical protein